MLFVNKVFILFVISCVHISTQHVVFKEPPARQSIGILRPQCGLPKNVEHAGVYCGGAKRQHLVNKGRCGICGDDYSAPVKAHEAGGRFATGTIARSYLPGQVIDVEVDILANHKGFFSFALCPHNDAATDPDPSCFTKLKVNNGSVYYVTPGFGLKRVKVQLPDISCKQCILQITYTSGNNWGSGPQNADASTQDCMDTNNAKVGCGPQETFRGCSDLCIGNLCPQYDCAKVEDIDYSVSSRHLAWFYRR